MTSRMPRGRGRKGSVPPHKRQCTPTDVVRVPMTTGGGEALHESDASGGFLPAATGAFPYSHWSLPPYHGYHKPVVPNTNLFTVTFIQGNIAVCAGCHNHYNNSKQPPKDLCIRHKEWREYTREGATAPCTRFSNVYYYCDPQCVWLRCPYV